MANLGRGIGPSIANRLMERFGGRQVRKPGPGGLVTCVRTFRPESSLTTLCGINLQGAFNAIMSLWVVCGLLVFLLAFTLLEDETRVQVYLYQIVFTPRN